MISWAVGSPLIVTSRSEKEEPSSYILYIKLSTLTVKILLQFSFNIFLYSGSYSSTVNFSLRNFSKAPGNLALIIEVISCKSSPETEYSFFS